MKVLAAGALLWALAAPGAAEHCNDAGLRRMEELCAPGPDGRRTRRCAKHLVYMNRDCAAREKELESRAAAGGVEGKLATRELKKLESLQSRVEQIDAQTPDYKAGEDERERPETAAAGPGGGAEPSPELARANEALRAGDAEGAERAASEAIAKNPQDPAAWAARMRARALRGDKEGARADAKRVLALDPAPDQGSAAETIIGSGGLDEAAERLGRRKLDFQNRSFEGLGGPAGPRRPGAPRQAQPSRDGAPAQDPSRPAEPARAAALAAALPKAAGGPKNEAADRAFGKLRVRDFSGAYDEATKAIAERDHARARTLRAAAANRLGRHDQADQDATAALAFKPGDVAALLERGYARYKLGRYASALADVDEALDIDPLNAMGYLYRGMILEKMSRVGEALSSYMKAGELDEGLKPVTDEHLARLKGGKGAPARGATLAERALKRWKLWLALLALAAVLLARGLRRAVKPEWATPVTPPTPVS